MALTMTRESDGQQTILTITREDGTSASVVSYQSEMRSSESVSGRVDHIKKSLTF
jgi:hypothetical protein